MWAGIGTALQIIAMVLKWWFGLDAEKKAKAKELMKGVPNAKDPSSITRMFDSINNS